MVSLDLERIGGDDMPRYFFHIRDGVYFIPDEEGIVFPDMCLAEVEGYASARDLAVDGSGYRSGTLAPYTVEVADEGGTVLRRINITPIQRFTLH